MISQYKFQAEPTIATNIPIGNLDFRYGDEVVDQFGPSRIPPWIAFRLGKARAAVIKAIEDIRTPKGKVLPSMIEVSTNEDNYRTIARSRSTLVIRRRCVGIYKGRLFPRGDTVPVALTAFIASPSANRSGNRRICMIASQTRWKAHALDDPPRSHPPPPRWERESKGENDFDTAAHGEAPLGEIAVFAIYRSRGIEIAR